MLRACPIGEFRLIDGEEADDKIIAVLVGDFIYEKFKDISELSANSVERLRQRSRIRLVRMRHARLLSSRSKTIRINFPRTKISPSIALITISNSL